MRASTFEVKMTKIFQEIGIYAETNCHYTHGLAQHIQQKAGANIESLTVGQILTLLREYNDLYNEDYLSFHP